LARPAVFCASCALPLLQLALQRANLTRATTRILLRSLIASLCPIFWDQLLGPTNAQACENRWLSFIPNTLAKQLLHNALPYMTFFLPRVTADRVFPGGKFEKV
jgi:hypothetical protein